MDHIGARDLVDERFGGQTEAILLPIGVLRAVRWVKRSKPRKGLVTDIPWNKLTNYYKLSFIDWLGKIGWGGAYDHLSIDCLMQVSLSFSIKQQTSGKGIQS